MDCVSGAQTSDKILTLAVTVSINRIQASLQWLHISAIGMGLQYACRLMVTILHSPNQTSGASCRNAEIGLGIT
jgi:hypothetical protein